MQQKMSQIFLSENDFKDATQTFADFFAIAVVGHDTCYDTRVEYKCREKKIKKRTKI